MALKDPERFVMKPQREGGGRRELTNVRFLSLNIPSPLLTSLPSTLHPPPPSLYPSSPPPSPGNNYYGKDVQSLLQRIGSTKEREFYILMDRIRPRTQDALILAKHMFQTSPTPIVGELGVYGGFVRSGIGWDFTRTGVTGTGGLLGLGVYWDWVFTGTGGLLGLGVYWDWGFTGTGCLLGLGVTGRLGVC